MASSLLVLFVLGIMCTGALVSPDKCPPNLLLPGSLNMGKGVDLTEFTLDNQDVAGMMKSPVIQQTCTLGNQVEYDKQIYTYYDQMWPSPTPEHKSVRDCEMVSVSNSFEFQARFQEDVQGSALFGLISASEYFSMLDQEVFRFSARLERCQGHVDGYICSLDLPNRLVPEDRFIQSIRDVPTLWFLPLAWPKVEEHFQYFGTHHVYAASFGGIFSYTSVVGSSYLAAFGEAHADAQASLDFLFFLELSGGASGSIQAEDTFVASLLRRKCVAEGGENGDTVCLSNSTDVYDAWERSIPTNEWMTGAKYRSNVVLLDSDALLAAKLDAMTIAYFAWRGVEKLAEMLAASLILLQKYATLPDAACSYSPSGCTTVVDPAGCVRIGTTGDPRTVIPVVRGNAKSLLSQATDLIHVLNTTIAMKATNASVDSFVAQAPSWQQTASSILSAVYSHSVVLSCSGAISTANYKAGCGVSCCFAPTDPWVCLLAHGSLKPCQETRPCSDGCGGPPPYQPNTPMFNHPPCVFESTVPSGLM